MKRAIFGILAACLIIPALTSGLVCRLVARSRLAQAVALLLLFAACAGCSAILERPARACHSEAWTVSAMLECNAKHPQQSGTLSDRIAQPLGELERHYIGRNNPGLWTVEIDGQTIGIHASSAAEAQKIARDRYRTIPTE